MSLNIDGGDFWLPFRWGLFSGKNVLFRCIELYVKLLLPIWESKKGSLIYEDVFSRRSFLFKSQLKALASSPVLVFFRFRNEAANKTIAEDKRQIKLQFMQVDLRNCLVKFFLANQCNKNVKPLCRLNLVEAFSSKQPAICNMHVKAHPALATLKKIHAHWNWFVG